MTTTAVFLDQLKATANNYLNDTFTKFKNIFRYSSAESRHLAGILSGLDPAEPSSLVDAVTAIDNYITLTGTSPFAKRRFWNDYLQPALKNLAKEPLTDLSTEEQETIQTLEFAARSALNHIQKHSALLYNGMGYDQSAVARHPALSKLLKTQDGLDACRGNLVLEALSQPSARNKTYELAPIRVLKLFFAQNIPLPNVQEFSNESRKQQPFFDFCLDMMDAEELVVLLKGIPSGHPAIQAVFPSILFKLVQPTAASNTLIHGLEFEFISEPTSLLQDQLSIESLIELERLGLETLTSGQLLGIITHSSADFFRNNVTDDELANAIHRVPVWNTLLANRQGSLPLTRLLPVNEAETILAFLHTKEIESQPGARPLSLNV